jgi:hypothetical protein
VGCAKVCASFRQQRNARLDSSVGLRTINQRINQIEPLVRRARSEPITDVPAVVQFDGIWLRVQTQTDTIKLDKRHQRSGKKVVLLVAPGFWTDGSGRREVLDWQVADSEGKAAWETLVNRLWERGVRPEKGLQAVGSRWLWRARGSAGLGVWIYCGRAALHRS